MEPSGALEYCLYPGPAPLLVLLSGLGDDLPSWSTSLLEALNRMAGILVYDRRGHGRSAALPPQPVTAEAVAADLQQLLQTLHSAPVVLVGHSLGGLDAQYFARNDPQQVAAVVLIDALPARSSRSRTRASRRALPSRPARSRTTKMPASTDRSSRPATRRRFLRSRSSC